MAESRSSIKQGAGGFTLLEVLVAFMILTISLGVLLQIFGGGLDNLSTSEKQAAATMLARSKLAAVGIEEPLYIGRTDGETDEGFRWQVTVSAYENQNHQGVRGQTPVWVEARVDWGKEDSGQSVILGTIRLMAGGG